MIKVTFILVNWSEKKNKKSKIQLKAIPWPVCEQRASLDLQRLCSSIQFLSEAFS